jgi:hypothetical protein
MSTATAETEASLVVAAWIEEPGGKRPPQLNLPEPLHQALDDAIVTVLGDPDKADAYGATDETLYRATRHALHRAIRSIPEAAQPHIRELLDSSRRAGDAWEDTDLWAEILLQLKRLQLTGTVLIIERRMPKYRLNPAFR